MIALAGFDSTASQEMIMTSDLSTFYKLIFLVFLGCTPINQTVNEELLPGALGSVDYPFALDPSPNDFSPVECGLIQKPNSDERYIKVFHAGEGVRGLRRINARRIFRILMECAEGIKVLGMCQDGHPMFWNLIFKTGQAKPAFNENIEGRDGDNVALVLTYTKGSPQNVEVGFRCRPAAEPDQTD